MSTNSAIEWTDATWNPVRGCVKVSPGCANCYAETFAERFRGVPGHPYEQGFDLRLVPEKLDRAAVVEEAAAGVRQQHVGPVPGRRAGRLHRPRVRGDGAGAACTRFRC
jgi:protein gp37